jgi:hypothetical protein
LVVDGSNDQAVDSHGLLNNGKSYFCQLLKVSGVKYVRWTEMRTTERLVPGHSSLDHEVATETLENNAWNVKVLK